jgi:hypothetical protein
MTRISIALIAALALVVCACEKQPIPGQTMVTHTHASNGDPRLEQHHGGEHKEDGQHPAPAEKKEGQPAEHAGAPEQKPTFFPEKK